MKYIKTGLLFLLFVIYWGNTRVSAFTITDNLPVTLIPATANTNSDYMVILYSGDGGWKDFVKDLAGSFASRGVPVVAVNSLKYFWTYQSPVQAAADAQALIKKYSSLLKKEKIILLGYSFGADVVPFIYNRLSADTKRTIEKTALISPSRGTDFVIRVSNMLNFGSKNWKFSTTEEVKKMNPRPLSFFGKEEDDSCFSIFRGISTARELEGAHHYTKGGISIITRNLTDSD